ncbi:MAG: lipocalin family protein [Bacteroidia bacterium]|nr:lipocalin family protein [Bacteroidia bacterium]
MKHTLTLMVMAMVVAFTACKKDKKDNNSGGGTTVTAQLEGITWKLTNPEDLFGGELDTTGGASVTINMTLTFKKFNTGADSVYTYTSFTITMPGLPPMNDEETTVGTYVKDGNKLTITDEDGESGEATILELTTTKLNLEVEVDDEDDNGDPITRKVVLKFVKS